MGVGHKMIEKFPFYYLVYVFTSGLILLFLSPIRFLFIEWIKNPYPFEKIDFFGSLSSVFSFSFCLGVFMYFFSPLLVSKSGINHRIMKHFFDDDNEEKMNLNTYFSRAEKVDFWDWIKKQGYGSYVNFLLTQRMLLSGIITGCEGSLLLTLPFGVLFFISYLFPYLREFLFLLFPYALLN